MTYLQRYLAGEYEQVWQELYALGPQIRLESLFPDAHAVAYETMRRARSNIEHILERLMSLNYQFAYPKATQLATPKTSVTVARFEEVYGPLPLALQAWFTVVGSVDLMGYHPSLSTYENELGRSSVITYADPLVVLWDDEPIDVNYVLPEDPDATYTMEFAPCYFHKSNYSGSGAVSFETPSLAIDVALHDDARKWTGIPFVTMLRTSLRWGGFAGFEEAVEARQEARAELAFLTRDLLPI